MNYNKEEVIKAWHNKYPISIDYPDINTNSSETLVMIEIESRINRAKLKHQDQTNFLSTALDAAYKAGKEEMYLAGGKACKKVYQNHKEDHLCRFNDGEQNCNCYLSGINEVIVALEELK